MLFLGSWMLNIPVNAHLISRKGLELSVTGFEVTIALGLTGFLSPLLRLDCFNSDDLKAALIL